MIRSSDQKLIRGLELTPAESIRVDQSMVKTSHGHDHSCALLKITSEITSLLEVLRGASNFGVILRNYLEAPRAGNQLLQSFFVQKNHKNRNLHEGFDFFAPNRRDVLGHRSVLP